MYTYVHTGIHVHIGTYRYTCTHTYIHIYRYTCTHTNIQVYMYISVFLSGFGPRGAKRQYVIWWGAWLSQHANLPVPRGGESEPRGGKCSPPPPPERNPAYTYIHTYIQVYTGADPGGAWGAVAPPLSKWSMTSCAYNCQPLLCFSLANTHTSRMPRWYLLA